MSSFSFGATSELQHAAWRDHTPPPVEQVRRDVWSIPVPLPDSSLRYVNVYVVADDRSLTLIDAGWGSDAAYESLESGLHSLGATTRDVTAVLVTHGHFDHVGLAGRVRDSTSAWVGMHPADRDMLTSPDFRDPRRAHRADVEALIRLGASVDEAQRLRPQRTDDPRSRMPLPDRLFEDGDDIRVAGRTLKVIHTPGHTPGHCVFFDEAGAVIFGGDHLLPRITPSITMDDSSDALGTFLSSLDRVADLSVDEVLPAHEWRYRELRARVGDLHEHHDRRLAEVLAAVRKHPGCAPWDIAGEITWSRSWPSYDGLMRVWAVNETAAHMIHLVHQGAALRTNERVPRYAAIRI